MLTFGGINLWMDFDVDLWREEELACACSDAVTTLRNSLYNSNCQNVSGRQRHRI